VEVNVEVYCPAKSLDQGDGACLCGGFCITDFPSQMRGNGAVDEDQNVGIAIASRSMQEPLRQIVTNAGEEDSVVLNKVRDGDMGGMGGMIHNIPRESVALTVFCTTDTSFTIF